jgi:hypothetical protein
LHRVDWSQIEISFTPDRAPVSSRWLGGAAFVAMMQSSDLGQRDDLAGSRSVYWPGGRHNQGTFQMPIAA